MGVPALPTLALILLTSFMSYAERITVPWVLQDIKMPVLVPWALSLRFLLSNYDMSVFVLSYYIIFIIILQESAFYETQSEWIQTGGEVGKNWEQ